MPCITESNREEKNMENNKKKREADLINDLINEGLKDVENGRVVDGPKALEELKKELELKDNQEKD